MFIYTQETLGNSTKNNLFKVSCALKQVFCPSLSHLFRSNAELVFENTVERSKEELFPCGLLLPSIRTKFWGCLLPFESFRFQDATTTIDWKNCTFKEYLSLSFKVVLVWGGLKMQPADRNDDILARAAAVGSDE